MKKISIATAFAASAVMFAHAQEVRGTAQVMMRPPVGVSQRAGVTAQGESTEIRGGMTGNAVIDAQIKVLLKEEQEKILAIHSEYQIKLRKLVGDRKLTSPVSMSSTTPYGMGQGQKNGADEGRKMGRPYMEASSTVEGTASAPMIRVGENNGQRLPQGRGFSQMMDFFRGLFGGNN